MHFSEITYQRPDIKKASKHTDNAIKSLRRCKTLEEAKSVLQDWDNGVGILETQVSLAHLKFAQNTQDAEAKSEFEYINSVMPKLQVTENAFLHELVNSPHRTGLEKAYGSQAFQTWELALNAFDERISDLKTKESELTMAYQQLMASIRITFQEEEYTLSTIGPLAQSSNREQRRLVSLAIDATMQTHQEKLDSLFDELVKVRHEMGVKMGRENFIDLGYDMLGRTDYGPDDVAIFRQEVKDVLVPICQQIRNRHAERLEVDDYSFYDESLHHKAGEPKPKGDEQWMREKAHLMFQELGHEFSQFYSMMENNGLMDLDSRDDKAGGGFCTDFYAYGVPFIFANFNGTHGDVRVFTHECGHAYQRFSSRNQPLRNYLWPTMEAAEIHSMSLEFFTYPQMHHFFNNDANLFILSHLEGALLFIPYGCAVDEFQHWVYGNPSATPDQRAAEWKRLEGVYLPWRKYEQEGQPYYSSGRYWQRQQHIYRRPFYYIDYCLAQSCALQFWAQAEINREDALSRYHNLCEMGGSHSFTTLLRLSGLKNPFESGTLRSVVANVTQTLNQLE